MTYEEMVADKPTFFRKVLDFCEIPFDERLRESISKCDVRPDKRIDNVNRFNVGVTGRGERVPSDLREYVLELCSFFPKVDFSRIGV